MQQHQFKKINYNDLYKKFGVAAEHTFGKDFVEAMNYYVCKTCGIIVFSEIDDYKFLISTGNTLVFKNFEDEQYEDLTCTEIVIKNIIE